MKKLSLAIGMAALCCLAVNADTGVTPTRQAKPAGDMTLPVKVARFADRPEPVTGYLGHIGGGSTSRVIETTYDNTSNWTWLGVGLPIGTEFGDELMMTGEGQLTNFSFSIANYDTADLYTVEIELKFYDDEMDFIGGYDLGTVSFQRPGGLPGGGWSTTFDDIDLTAAGIYLPDNVVCTQVFTNPIGSGPGFISSLGPLIFDPPTVGASEDSYYWNGAWYSFHGSPVANFYYKVDMKNPAPPPPPVYDNSTGSNQGGVAVAVGCWLGDDITFEDYGSPPAPSWALNGGMLDKLQWTFWNYNPAADPAGVISADWTVEFFDRSDTSIIVGTHSWHLDYGGDPLAAGYYTTWSAHGLKATARIALPRGWYGIRCKATNVEWEAGKTPGQIGQIRYWPPSVGNSDNRIWVDGTWLYYPGTASAFLYKVDVRQFFKGDMNCDGVINNFDIDPFTVAVVSGQPYYHLCYPDCEFMNADVNQDGTVDNFDIDPFVDLLT